MSFGSQMIFRRCKTNSEMGAIRKKAETEMQQHRQREGYQIEMMDQRHSCPCGCPGSNQHNDRDSVKIKTKELLDGSETVDRWYGMETLKYQGCTHCADEIAKKWRKDCRMWLWKSAEKSTKSMDGKV